MELTVKDKAKDLVNKFAKHTISVTKSMTLHNAKECALLAVDEIIEELIELDDLLSDEVNLPYKYWQNVKSEIILL